ncbi:MAG: T9SS type A sorting domain-containing protein [Janthinobacterium lividum]
MTQLFTRLTLLTAFLLLGYASRAQYTQTFTGSLTTTSPNATWRPDIGSTALCGRPGSVGAQGTVNPAYRYATHTIRNAGTVATCLTVTLTAACTETRTILLVSAYAPGYDYAGPFTSAGIPLSENFRGNPGQYAYAYPGNNHTTSFPLQLEAGASALLVVSAYDMDTYCSSYSLTIASPQPLPTIAAQSVFPLAFYPNPVSSQATFSSPAATTLTVRDPLGRIARVLPLAAGTQQVSLEQLPAGVYSLTDETTRQTTRLVKATQ